jgi:hypothetical protein
MTAIQAAGTMTHAALGSGDAEVVSGRCFIASPLHRFFAAVHAHQREELAAVDGRKVVFRT